MSFDWSDFLIVAQELTSQTASSLKTRSKIWNTVLNIINRAYNRDFRKIGRHSLDEARLRCAISRAYYGAFRKARNHLRDKDGYAPNVIERSGKTHQIVIDLFSHSSDLDRQLIGQSLKDLRSARNKADYDDAVLHLSGLTMTALLQSEEVLELLKAL